MDPKEASRERLMPVRHGTEKRAMNGQVYARVPASTASRIAALAAADGLTGAAWARRVLVAAAGSDPGDAIPVPARRAPKPPIPAHVLEVARLRESVAELAGAMVRAAVLARTEAATELHAEIEAILPGVRAAVRDLDALKRAAMDSRS